MFVFFPGNQITYQVNNNKWITSGVCISNGTALENVVITDLAQNGDNNSGMLAIDNNGKEITIDRFVEICLKLQEMGANNINLVTPTMYIPLIKEGLIIAKEKGLYIPIVYNSSGYESVEAIKELDGLIDIYLPDFKYYDDKLASSFSMANNYCLIAKDTIKEMYRQVKKPIFKDDIMVRGMIVRHLLLPNHVNDSKKIIKYLFSSSEI